MDRETFNGRLSRISTVWTILHQAHAGAGDQARAAQALLLERYGGAVRRYLGRLVGNADEAEELMQEFALRLLRGDFREASPERGRFRSYVKVVLSRLVARHRRGEARRPRPAGDSPALAGVPAPVEDLDVELDQDWRAQLLARTWAALSEAQPASYAVLRFKAEHSQLSSEEAAARFGEGKGRAVSPAAYRQALHRARERFALLLAEEVAHSLETPTAERVEEELRCLDLLKYCAPLLRPDP